MARKQLTGGWKIIDDWLFHGAEQKTIARENSEANKEYLEKGNVQVTSYACYEGGVSGSCSNCGRSFAVNYTEVPLPDGSTDFWCAQCSNENVADPDQLAWNKKSKAIRI